MFENAFRLGSIAGIRIGIHYTWLIIFFLLVSTLYQNFRIEYDHWSPFAALISATVTTLLFFVSIVLHELGHSMVALYRGIQVRSITLFIFGGVAQTEKEADSASTEFWVAIAGPLVSLVLAGIFYVLAGIFASSSELVSVSLNWLGRINLIIAIFNLIPGFPLDGGRVFRALIWSVSGNAQTGMRWAVASGKFLAYILMAFGLLLALQPGLLLNGIWLLAIGWFLLFNAQASGQSFMISQAFRQHQAREYMDQDFSTVPGSLTITQWMEGFVFTEGKRASVVTEDHLIIGLVTIKDCNKVAREAWNRTTLREIMTAIEDIRGVAATASISEVLQLMVAHSYNQVPVMEQGRIIGWLDRERLIRIIQLHDETGI